MALRQWTVIVLPDDNSTAKQYRLSRDVVRATIALALFLVAGLAALGGAALAGTGVVRADERLIAKNDVLARELEEMAQRVETLEGSLGRLSEKDAHYRLLAGLEPLGSEVLQAGVGGPDADSLESRDLFGIDPQLGRRAFHVSSQLNTLIRRASLLASSWDQAENALTVEHARLRAMPSINPTEGYVSSSFSSSRMHPLLDRARPHMGIDIVAPTGTPVVATANGRVKVAATRGHYGLMVEIDHGHGLVTRYAHMSKLGVKAGQSVKRGQNIGAVGTTGLSAGPHLHYEVLVNGRQTNPSRYILDLSVVP